MKLSQNNSYQKRLSSWEMSLVHVCCEVIRAGKILALETDTVPGLAVNALDMRALRELYQLKKRETQKPIVWMTHNIELFRKYIEISPLGEQLINQYWPGALTLIFPLTILGEKTFGKRLSITGHSTQTLALRIPRYNFLCACLEALQTPLAVTSANYSNKGETTSLKTVRKLFKFKINAYLERRQPMSGTASTLVDLSQNPPKILRAGELTPQILQIPLIKQ